jgi:hypothetical protein
MGTKSEIVLIKQTLAAGRLTVPDKSTGYYRSIYACCPSEGHESPVHRIERSGISISRVIFQCPICSVQFDTRPENMFLR